MNKYIVEFLGTLFFVFIILSLGNPLAIGSALAIVIILGGKISGGHFNPAVSVMLAMSGKFAMKDLAPYVLAQIGGGLAALEFYKRVKF